MRHQVQPATSQDVAYLATLLEDVPGYLDWPEKEPSDRLLEALRLQHADLGGPAAERRLDQCALGRHTTDRQSRSGLPLDAGLRHVR